MNFKTTLILLSAILPFSFSSNGQSLKDKMKASKEKLASKVPSKDRSADFECGFVYQESMADKANPMKALGKAMGGAATKGSNPDLGTAAISVFYQAHLHPQFVMKYPTKTPDWETCGDAVYLGFTNKSGAGLSSTDGTVTLDGKEILYSGVGTYFQGFKPENRGTKQIEVKSSDGDQVSLKVSPAESLEITSINGKPRGENIIIDGSQDITLEIGNGDADPTSKLHVQMVCKMVGTPIMYDIFIADARNTLIIPKEAFKSFEGSPAPFLKNNILIVNRIKEKVIDNTAAGALRTISAYMDWTPVTMSGDLAKGNMITMGMDASKNVSISFTTDTLAKYVFDVNKAGPFYSPPMDDIKKVAVGSFIIRGNMESSNTSIEGDWIVKSKKWFPRLNDETWQQLVEEMYKDFETKVSAEFGYEMVPLDQVVNSEAYKYAKPITDGVKGNYVEVGAGGTQRIVSTRWTDIWKDAGISFGSDFVSERLIRELDVDAVISVVIDLDFNFETESLDPKVNIVAFAPNISYKQESKYFTMNARSTPMSFDDAKDESKDMYQVIYQMINAETLAETYMDAFKQLQKQENETPQYKAIWDAKK